MIRLVEVAAKLLTTGTSGRCTAPRLKQSNDNLGKPLAYKESSGKVSESCLVYGASRWG